MTGRITVLGSGSSGNATLVAVDGFALLIDCGLHAADLTARLATVGSGWHRVRAVLLTHTHTDHWNRYTLEQLRRSNVTLFLHPDHHAALGAVPQFEPLRRAGLLRDFAPHVPIALTPALHVRPVPVPHDSEPTFGFRLDAGDPHAPAWSFGLASDLGCMNAELLAAFHEVDALALEFNHDERMERQSRRPRHLIDRVLGDFGHLSNRQAGEAVRLLLEAAPGRLRSVMQLHLSRECNTPELAGLAGRTAAKNCGHDVAVITTRQDCPAPTVDVSASAVPRGTLPPPRIRHFVQPTLPGFA